ncbi:hypothetical protein FBU30_008268 [Linnemannia zychae]|nr:hypothetical protein FBU30_008268 [Linnemannia zychae]
MSDLEQDDHSPIDVWEDDNGDDVWGNDDNVSYDRAIAQKEWDRLHENFGNAGYLEGIEEGKEGTLQQGFNQGWSEGVQYGHELGRLRGLISPLLEYMRSSLSTPTAFQNSLLSHIDDRDAWISKASELVKELIELDISKVFDKAYFDDGRGPKTTLSASIDTNHKKNKDSGCCGGGNGESNASSSSSCCQNKSERSVKDPGDTRNSSTSSKNCCRSSGTEESCQSNKDSCKSSSEAEDTLRDSKWSSMPEQIVNEYKTRVRALLQEANLETLSQTV